MAKNKHNSRTISLSTLFALLVSGALCATCGVFFVVLKNKQVQTQREIDLVQKKIQEHEVAITSHKADIEDHLGVFRLKDNLVVKQSGLVPIPPGLIEVCEDQSEAAPPNHVVASHR